MAEWRTLAQVDADDALAQAIASVLLAYAGDSDTHHDFMLTEYVVIAARVGMSDAKANHTEYEYVFSNGSLPWHNGIGLVDWCQAMMREDMRGRKVDEE